jgi:hypothetical protein
MLLVGRLFENAAVELKPRQLAIVEAVRSLRYGLNACLAASALHGRHGGGMLRKPVRKSI